MTPDTPPPSWTFYGREPELAAVGALLDARRFFFLRVTGRRRHRIPGKGLRR